MPNKNTGPRGISNSQNGCFTAARPIPFLTTGGFVLGFAFAWLVACALGLTPPGRAENEGLALTPTGKPITITGLGIPSRANTAGGEGNGHRGPKLQEPAMITVGALLDAIAHVETAGEKDPDGTYKRDTNGLISRGRYQIQEAFWTDASEEQAKHFPNTGWQWLEHAHFNYIARSIIMWYWVRYAGLAWDMGQKIDWAMAAKCSRIFNGGPRGHKKTATLKYWGKVWATIKDQEKARSERAWAWYEREVKP